MTKNDLNFLNPVYVAGLKINAVTKQQFLTILLERIRVKTKTFVITPYSEFLYQSLRFRKLRELYNRADIALPDGIGVLLAERFLAGNQLSGSFWLRVAKAWVELLTWCLKIIFQPNSLYVTFPEKIVGAEMVWDIADFCARNNLRLFLLGSRPGVAQKSADKLKKQCPNLQIVGVSAAHPGDPNLVDNINQAAADVLLVAYGPPKQELWIDSNLDQLDIKVVMGVGGSFDYISGEKINPPAQLRSSGYEWLFRLITQPYRLPRIIQATWGMMVLLVRHRVFNTYPFRQNGVCVILNKQGQILIVKRNPVNIGFYIPEPGSFDNYWQLPQGGIDKDESLVEGCLRELKEELNLSSLTLLGISDKQYSYIWDNAKRRLFSRSWKNKGQEQRIVFFRFEGHNKEIHPDHRELVDWQWVNIDQLLSAVHNERQDLTKIVIQDLPMRISQAKSMG